MPPATLEQSLASQLFAASLFPYLAFLYYLTKSGKAPRLVLGGFYFLLAFVGATIPAGIYGEQLNQQQQQQPLQCAGGLWDKSVDCSIDMQQCQALAVGSVHTHMLQCLAWTYGLFVTS